MAKKTYEDLIQTFPSDEFLCEMFGAQSYEEMFEKHFKLASQLIAYGHILQLYQSDVGMSEAISRGELIQRGERWELNKELFRKNHNLFQAVRHGFDSALRAQAMFLMRNQNELVKDWDGTACPTYLFKDGRYGEEVWERSRGYLPPDDKQQLKLCREFIAIIKEHQLSTDVWWEYRFEGDSVWLQPKELNDELKAAMQKIHDEEVARSYLCTYPFYPGWEPDKSKDPPNNWIPVDSVTRFPKEK